jgi:hypothetical protein
MAIAVRTGALERAGGAGRELVVAGAAVGLAGGVLMAAWLVVSAAAAGVSPLGPLRRIGLTFLGPEAVEGDPAVLAFGIFLHLVVSALLGIVFTWILPAGFPWGSAAVVGLGFAWVVMAFATSLVLPAVNPALRAQMPALGGSWVLAHAVYGLAIGAGPRLRAALRAGR